MIILMSSIIGFIITKKIPHFTKVSFKTAANTLYDYGTQKIHYLFPIKAYPGQLLMTVPESTGALGPEYFKRYTYTYTAEYDGKTYTQDNTDFIQQKKVPTNLMGGHASLELSIAKNAPADVFICIFKNSFDYQHKIIKSEWIGSFKTID